MKKIIHKSKILLHLIIYLIFFSLNNSIQADFLVTNIASLKTDKYGVIFSEEVKITVEENWEIQEDKSRVLMIRKTASREYVKVGEIFRYSIQITNFENEIFEDGKKIKYLIVNDILPSGINMVPKSLKINEGLSYEIIKNSPNSTEFKIKIIETEIDWFKNNFNSSIEISYLAQVGIKAKIGKNISYVDAKAFSRDYYYRSNLANVEVEIISDLFDLKGIIYGRVYLDINKSGEFDEDDLPVPGAKIYLENGDFAITDRDGKYSIYGENSITHIVRLDDYSVPKGAKLIPLSNRYNKTGNSVFSDLKTSQLHKVNFTFIDADNLFVEKIKARKKLLEETPNEFENIIKNNNLEFFKNEVSQKRLNRDGIISGRTLTAFRDHEIKNIQDEGKIEHQKVQTTIKDREEEIGKLIKSMDNELDFINLKDGDVVSKISYLQIKYPMDGSVETKLNGEKISEGKLGLTATLDSNRIAFKEYAGVEMRDGKNELELIYLDGFGNVRKRKKIKVIVPGKFQDFRLEIIEGTEEDSSGQPVKVKFIAVDRDDNRIMKSITATLNISSGKWLATDGDPNKEGLQFITDSNGEAILLYLPADGARNLIFNVSCEEKTKKISLPIKREKRPLMVNGIIDGRVDFKGAILERDSNYIFENKLSNYEDRGDKGLSYRSALFLKGDIHDKYHLTLAYDNNVEDRKFFAYRDPNEYFPIYGDNSIKGYEAQSVSKLYLKIDGENGHFLYGDYETNEWHDSELELSKYSRTLNGGVFRYNGVNIMGGFFAARTASRLVVEEFQGRGISGPYDLKNRKIIEGSVNIELITYDRGNPAIIIDQQYLSNQSDYVVDYDIGRIFFAAPVMSTDIDFNPIFIQVNYEVDEGEGAEKFWIYGGDLSYSPMEKLSFGMNFVNDEREFDTFSMLGLNSKFEITNNRIVLEGVETDNFEIGKGKALIIKHIYNGEKLKIENQYYNSDSNFETPNSSLGSNLESFETNSQISIFGNKSLRLTGKYIRDKESEKEQKEIYLGMDGLLKIKDELRLDVGMRYYSQTEKKKHQENNENPWENEGVGDESFDFDFGEDGIFNEEGEDDYILSLAGRIIWSPLILRGFEGFAEYEQNLVNSGDRLGVGLKYSLEKSTRLYARQELFSNLGNDYVMSPTDTSNKSVVGIETNYFKIGKLFSEYRLEKDGEEIKPELTSGIKQDWNLTENIKLYATYERVTPLMKKEQEKNLEFSSEEAITFGYNIKIDETSRTAGDFEVTISDSKDYLAKLMYGKKISESLSIFVKNRYFSEDSSAYQNRTILGMAYRNSKNDRYSNLNKYEFNYEKNIRDDYSVNSVHLLMSSHNYQFSSKGVATFSFSGKYINQSFEGYKTNYFAQMITVGLNYDITSKIDMGFNGAVLADKNFNDYKYGMGIEMGYQLPKNIWISGGYNIFGFSDSDFDPSGNNRQGPYVRFRMKLDEDIFR